MSEENKNGCVGGADRSAFYGVLMLGALFAGTALVWMLVHYTQPAPLTAGRAELRRQALAELRAANTEALTTYAWLDKDKGIVRLPIEQAMKLTLAEWQNPDAGRSNLVARVEKATAVAPKPAEKPSQFE